MKAQIDQQGSTLDRELYKKREGCVERERMKHKENGPSMRFGNRTENERIKEVVEFNKMNDYSFKDTKMLYYPDWRDPKRKKMRKGQSMSEFNHYKNKFGYNTDTAWTQFPIRENEKDFDPYVDGLEKIGNEISLRKRDKGKEVFSD